MKETIGYVLAYAFLAVGLLLWVGYVLGPYMPHL